jgi:hypothetical protein
MKVMATNTQTDAVSSKIRVLSKNALKKGEITDVGFEEEVKRAVMAVNVDFSDLDSPCLPKPQNSIRTISGY